MFSPDTIRNLVLTLVVMLLSLSVHEFAHALAADRLGDDTPRRQGRLTLSPLEHYDIFGTFLIPIAAAFFGSVPMIGWARPVQFNPTRLTRKLTMRTGSMVVAAAGPLSNLVLACLSYVALVVCDRSGLLMKGGVPLLAFLSAMVLTNLGLFVFNLLPIPPLDGSRLLPRRFDSVLEKVAPFSFLLLLVVVSRFGSVIRQPVNWLLVGFERVAHAPIGGF
ncbi:MAG: site-2 protease family protein [Polyangiaceae bacterium]|nr:site-2 protease family protein [Polyangiaceae bacterium]MCB9605229.1 site-2 protease family protein [Polyangiaceae bacterium]